MKAAGIVLAGGRSTRMGRPKAELEWHGSTLLRRAVGIVARAVDGPVVVVRARGQQLPALPPPIEVVEDQREGRGPLQGIAGGLAALGERAEIVFVAGVDTPLLHPALVAHVLRSLRPADDVALPRAGGFQHPLAGAYRAASVAPLLHDVLAGERLGTGALLDRCRVRELDEAALLADPAVAALDPALDSLANLNTPEEYEAARARPAPQVIVHRSADSPPLAMRAATLAAAATQTGVVLAEVDATCNGRRVDDPQEPLASGDALAFHR